MTNFPGTTGLPPAFAAAQRSVRTAEVRADLVVEEISAPANVAPYAIAFSGNVAPVAHGSDSEFGTGRFIVLHDPDEPEAWGGDFRIVCFAQAPLEPEIGVDPFLASVTWSWLIDALDGLDAQYTNASGTATKILSTGFGELADQGEGAQIELRASWTPRETDLAKHIDAWSNLIGLLAGLPPRADVPSLISLKRTK